MEPGEIDEAQPMRSVGRKGRYKARRQHKRHQTKISLPFEPPKRLRLETHLSRNEPVPRRLPASGHHAILSPAYAGTETPRWAAFRLSKVIKEDSLERLEKGVKGLSSYGIRHSMGHKAKVLNTRIRHLRKEIVIRQRQFIKIYDDVFGRKLRKLVYQMDPTTARSMSINHRRISRLLKLDHPKHSTTPHNRATKRFKKSHQYLKVRPPARNQKAKSLRMGGMGTTMAITPSSDQGKQWHLPCHAHNYYTILSCLGHSTTLHLPELGYVVPMKPGDVAGVLAGQLVHTLIPETGPESNGNIRPTTSRPVVIACWTDGPTEDKISAWNHFGYKNE